VVRLVAFTTLQHDPLARRVVPCGLTGAGLPIGLQIVGPLYAEDRVLRAARAFETTQPSGARAVCGMTAAEPLTLTLTDAPDEAQKASDLARSRALTTRPRGRGLPAARHPGFRPQYRRVVGGLFGELSRPALLSTASSCPRTCAATIR